MDLNSILDSNNLIIAVLFISLGLIKIILVPDVERKIEPYYLRKLRTLFREILLMMSIFFYVSIISYIDIEILNSILFFRILLLTIGVLFLVFQGYLYATNIKKNKLKVICYIKKIKKNIFQFPVWYFYLSLFCQ